LITIFGDFSMFYLIPFVSGFLRVESKRQYDLDKTTYKNAEITELQIYKESLSMFKDKFWQIFGKIPRDGVTN
jgi:hypothetical protein